MSVKAMAEAVAGLHLSRHGPPALRRFSPRLRVRRSKSTMRAAWQTKESAGLRLPLAPTCKPAHLLACGSTAASEVTAVHYKFLDSRDVDRVLVDGTMMVSSLEYFRKLEASAGDIGDHLEGATEVTVRGGLVATEASPELETLNAANIGLGLYKQFVKVESGGTISIGAGVRFIHVMPPLFIYSFSVGNLDLLSEEMCVKAPLPYDACLKIKDAEALRRECFDRGTIRSLFDKKVGDLFQAAYISAVEYVPRSMDVTEGAAMLPDPFKKAERFMCQSEVRFVFVPHDSCEIPAERLVLAIPDPGAHFELVFRDRAKT